MRQYPKDWKKKKIKKKRCYRVASAISYYAYSRIPVRKLKLFTDWPLLYNNYIIVIKRYSHLMSFEVITISVRSIRFHRIGLMVAVYQSLQTNAQFLRSSADRNLNAGTNAIHRFFGSLSSSSESNFGTGRITYLGMWLRFFELDSIWSIGTSALLAIGSLVRISSSIFTLPDTVAATMAAGSGVAAVTLSGMYSDCGHET